MIAATLQRKKALPAFMELFNPAGRQLQQEILAGIKPTKSINPKANKTIYIHYLRNCYHGLKGWRWLCLLSFTASVSGHQPYRILRKISSYEVCAGSFH